MAMKSFRTYSGDNYLIPAEQYEHEVKEYREALNRGDERTMLKFEGGETGWKYAP